jgi:thioredoxin-related protein
MKRILILSFLSIMFSLANAAETAWLTNLPTAQAQAKAENKIVLMDFTGSDWCPACIRFGKEVLASADFQKYAAKNVVVVEVDFPQNKPQADELKKANAELQDRFKVEAFPTLVVLDQNGKEIGRQVGYGADGPKAFIAKIEQFKAEKK